MAKLKAATRNALPSSAFGLPKQRKYPLDSTSRQENAKSRATQMVQAGKLSPASASKIREKANKLLRRGSERSEY